MFVSPLTAFDTLTTCSFTVSFPFFNVKEIEVKTGFSDGENVEITSGLEEGQKILVQNMEDESEETE